MTEQFRDDALPGQVDVGDVAQQYLDIALLTQHDPGRRSDFSSEIIPVATWYSSGWNR